MRSRSSGFVTDASASSAAEEHLLAHLDTIDVVVAHTARRSRLSATERDELRSLVRLKLVEKDYEVVRRFEGRSSFRGYLTVVVQRVLLDWRISQWGKWRPSAVARRSGPLAVRLEALLFREKRTLDEAIEVLRVLGFPESREGILALAGSLPRRTIHREVGEDAARELPTGGSVEDAVLDGEARLMAERAEETIASALESLEPRDRVVLKMHFIDDCPLSEVARVLGVAQKPLYRQVKQALSMLRERLHAEGVSTQTIGHLLDDGRLGSHLHLTSLFSSETTRMGPSR